MTIPQLIKELHLVPMPMNSNLRVTQKMWRDGYNKCLEDIKTKLLSLEADSEKNG